MLYCIWFYILTTFFVTFTGAWRQYSLINSQFSELFPFELFVPIYCCYYKKFDVNHLYNESFNYIFSKKVSILTFINARKILTSVLFTDFCLPSCRITFDFLRQLRFYVAYKWWCPLLCIKRFFVPWTISILQGQKVFENKLDNPQSTILTWEIQPLIACYECTK